MDFRSFFTKQILEQTYIDPRYAGHGSDIWRVATASEIVIIRTFREEERKGPFWIGCHHLFGLEARDIFSLGQTNAILAQMIPLPVPQTLRKGIIDDRPFVILEYMPGITLDMFTSLSESALEHFGRVLAHTHAHVYSYHGTLDGHTRYPLSTFNTHLCKVMNTLVQLFHAHDHKIHAYLHSICETAAYLPALQIGVPILIDINPSQYLMDKKGLTALVDTEAYVIGPREFDFIALEYSLNRREAGAFMKGYGSVIHPPDLSVVRSVYRYLYRLLEVRDVIDIDIWMSHPPVFDEVK
jgi:aminoglycoside phosphotransferase (APT) family kinase protein